MSRAPEPFFVTIAQRAGEDWFQIEDHLAHEAVGDGRNDASAPAAAGGALRPHGTAGRSTATSFHR